MLSRYEVHCSFVNLTDERAWANAVTPATRMFYLETPSNPLNEVANLEALSNLARARGVTLVVDNCFCTPALQQPLLHGADVVIHSATKYIDGQGRILGGAILGKRSFIEGMILPLLRCTGPALSAFNAWVLLKGLETLRLRMCAQSANALDVALWLDSHPAVRRVHYPGLCSHPQRSLIERQQTSGGAIVSFEVGGNDPEEQRARAWSVIDQTRLISITGNLGDTKTTITHPASTTHGRLSAQARAEAGIGEGLIRLAVGLEVPDDLRYDLDRGLAQLGG
jgi:O-succinylhomoserine sulfhydrylase